MMCDCLCVCSFVQVTPTRLSGEVWIQCHNNTYGRHNPPHWAGGVPAVYLVDQTISLVCMRPFHEGGVEFDLGNLTLLLPYSGVYKLNWATQADVVPAKDGKYNRGP